MAEYSLDILKHAVIDPSTIYKKLFGRYNWDKAMRRTVQLPVVIFSVQLIQGDGNEKKRYVTKFLENIDYRKYVDWYCKMCSFLKKEEKSILTSSQLKAVCKLAGTESDRLLIRYAACESSGLSINKAKQIYGIDEYGL